MCEFNIQEIELFNYRQFEDKKFVLNSRMNVFAGKNGSGKTTVLEAVNVVLGAYLAAFKTYVPSRFVFNIKSTDARRKTQISDDSRILTAGAIPQYPCKNGKAKSQMQITLMKMLFCHWYYTLVQHDFGKMEIKEQ